MSSTPKLPPTSGARIDVRPGAEQRVDHLAVFLLTAAIRAGVQNITGQRFISFAFQRRVPLKNLRNSGASFALTAAVNAPSGHPKEPAWAFKFAQLSNPYSRASRVARPQVSACSCELNLDFAKAVDAAGSAAGTTQQKPGLFFQVFEVGRAGNSRRDMSHSF